MMLQGSVFALGPKMALLMAARRSSRSPVPPVSASEYFPRANRAGGAPGASGPGCVWIGVLAVTCAIERQLTPLQSPKLPVWKPLRSFQTGCPTVHSWRESPVSLRDSRTR